MVNETLYRLVYLSEATDLYTSNELMAILEQARERNQRSGISGLLLYKDGTFIQLLEGPEDEVKSLVNRIEQDPRHRQFIVLMSGVAERRLFDGWAMGFRDLDDPQLADMPGFSEYLNRASVARDLGTDPSGALELLKMFAPQY